LRACHNLIEEKIAVPILLGRSSEIQAKSLDLGLDLKGVRVVDPSESPLRESYIQELCRLRQRRGVTPSEGRTLINDPNLFGSMMVHTVAGWYAVITRKGDIYFLADCTVNIDPTAEDLAEIALCAAEAARRFDVVPRIAMLSFSSFGSTKHALCEKVRKAVDLLHKADPTLVVDGEVMADVAVSPEMLEEMYPFSALKGGANVLVCPDLNSANIAYKLLAKIGDAEMIGPILMG